MAETTTCPDCQRALRIPDELIGQDVKCPACGKTFTASQAAPGPRTSPAAAPRPRDEPPAEERRPAREDRDDRDRDDRRRRPARRDDPDEDPRDDDRPRRRSGRGLAPHRGQLILILGIVGFFFPIPCSPMAWWMGNQDLAEIKAGRMDPEGESNTKVGKILGMVVTLLNAAFFVLCCGGMMLAALAGGLK